MLQDEYDAVKNELTDLKNKRQKFEDKLKQSYSEEDIIECKYQIKKINKEISRLEEKQLILSKKLRGQKGKDFLYKKLYVELDDDLIAVINQIFNINQTSEEYTINYLINNYSENQIYDLINLLKALSSSERENFIKTMHAQNIHVDVLVKRYNNSNAAKKLNPEIKKLIFEVEDELGLKFDGIYSGEVLFIEDLSQIVDFESFLLNEFEEYCMDYITEIYNENTRHDFSWDEIPEYDKLRLIPIDNCLERYYERLLDAIEDIVGRKFDFNIDITIPKHTTPIHEQTSEYKQGKDNLIKYKKNVDKYSRLIEKKRRKKQPHQEKSKCNKKLTKKSPIEDIADCFCKIEGFNNWEYDKKDSKKIVFKVLHADGKKYSRMKKMEIKKLKKWADKSK